MRCARCECAGDLSGPVGVFVAGEDGEFASNDKHRIASSEGGNICDLTWGPPRHAMGSFLLGVQVGSPI